MRLKEIQFRLLTLLAIALFFVSPAKSQVIIGKDSVPHQFSLLELSTDMLKGGLRLPQLTTVQRNALNINSNPSLASGLVIYNLDNNCLEFWNSKEWVSLCTPIDESLFSVDPKSLNFAYNESGSNKSKTVAVTTTYQTWSFSVNGVNAGDFAVNKSGNTLDVYPLTWNYGDVQRTATITVTGGGFTETVQVTQDPYEAAIGEIVSSAPLLYVDADGKIQLGRWGIEINRDNLLNFKFGSVIGFIIPSSASTTAGITTPWEGVDNIKFNPSNVATNAFLSQFSTTDPNNSQYNNIPYYDISLRSTYPTGTEISSSGYHNGVNVLKGLGDPCQLVGYTGAELAAMTPAQIDAIKSGWRMPTKIEDIDFVNPALHPDFDNYTPNPPNAATRSIPEDATHHFWGGPPPTGATGDINNAQYKFGGGWFEITSGARNTDANKFLPVVGYRAGGSNAGLSRFQGTHGFFWSSTSFFGGDFNEYVYGFTLSIDAPNQTQGAPAHTYPVSFNYSFYGFPIRCVQDTP